MLEEIKAPFDLPDRLVDVSFQIAVLFTLNNTMQTDFPNLAKAMLCAADEGRITTSEIELIKVLNKDGNRSKHHDLGPGRRWAPPCVRPREQRRVAILSAPEESQWWQDLEFMVARTRGEMDMRFVGPFLVEGRPAPDLAKQRRPCLPAWILQPVEQGPLPPPWGPGEPAAERSRSLPSLSHAPSSPGDCGAAELEAPLDPRGPGEGAAPARRDRGVTLSPATAAADALSGRAPPSASGSLTAGEGDAWSGSLTTAAVREHAASAVSASPALEEAVRAVEAERVGREGAWV